MGGNIRKKSSTKSAAKAANKSAPKTAKKARSVKAVTPKPFGTAAPIGPDRMVAAPRRELRLPVAASTDRPVRPVEVTRPGWTEKLPPKPRKPRTAKKS